MAITEEQPESRPIIPEIFVFGGVECRAIVSQSPTGYVATTYCPFCGKGIGGGRPDLKDAAVLLAKAKIQDHFGHCPMRNTERLPLGVKPI